MTTTDLRDIAAYYGAACSYEVDLNGRRKTVNQPVNVGFLQKLELFPDWKEFKIHLRPLSALTDEQLVTLFETAFGEKWDSGEPNGVDNTDGVIQVYSYIGDRGRLDYTIDPDGKIAFSGWISGGMGYYCPFVDALSMTRQLQAWGYYVPGTIDEMYVKLIEE